MGATVGGGGPGRGSGPPGVSLVGFLVTLAVLLLFLFVILDFANRWTRIPAPAPAPPGLKTALDNAARSLSRDLETAASGRLPPEQSIRPVGDNTPPDQAYLDFRGEMFVVRPGTDRLGLRGILRSPLLVLEPADRATGRPFWGGPGAGPAGTVPASPSAARLKIYARGPVAGRADAGLAAVLVRLRALPPDGTRKRFFIAGADGGAWAVARLLSFADRTAGSADGCPAPPDGCHLGVVLDFTDGDAARMNPEGDRDAWRKLGALSWGGLLDDVVYFVARGARGAPPDYFSVNDPPSVAYPHPFLALAESAGSDRWDIVKVADDIENLQVAWAVARPSGDEWRADRPGAAPLALADLLGGGLRLGAIRIAVVAKSAQRRLAPQGTEIPEDALPFNAPPPSREIAPVGWALNRRDQVVFDRETRFIMVRVSGPSR